MNQTTNKLIHIAKITKKDKGTRFLFLREVTPLNFVWFEEDENGTEQQTSVRATQVEDALLFASEHWKMNHFKTINCGFRYTLPERDEHGVNALFYQMLASYNSMNGIYFDDTVGHNCIVYNASIEARELLKKLQSQLRT